MKNRFSVIPVLLFFPVCLFAQIGREFKSAKVNGDVVQATEKFYENVVLDNNGVPVLTEKSENESLHFYENGYLTESQNFDIESEKRELSIRILLKWEGPVVRSAEVYTYRQDKESLLRSHEAVIKNGKLLSEKIRNNRKDIGNVQYSYGKTTRGLYFELMESESQDTKVNYYTESDEHGIVFSMQVNGTDTIMRQIQIERQGDTLQKSLIINKHGRNNNPDSVLLTERKWPDGNGNPTLVLQQMTALTEVPPGEPKSVNFLSAFTYYSSKTAPKIPTIFPNQETILGAWRSEINNLELFFEPESINGKPNFYGTPYLSKSNEPTVDELLAAGEIWKYMLKQDFAPGTWSLAENGELSIILKSGATLLFSTTMDFQILVLNPKMDGMKGSLRLAKSK